MCSNNDILLKVKAFNNSLSCCVLQYTYRDNKNVIKIGKFIPIHFNDTDEYNIKKMNKVSSKSGFLFWNNSKSGEDWIKNNIQSIVKLFSKCMLNQK